MLSSHLRPAAESASSPPLQHLNFQALSLGAATKLDGLPLDILLIILTHLDTAKSVAGLSRASRKLHRIVKEDGWRVFVRSHFAGVSLPPSTPEYGWDHAARSLTWHSKAWDRHALAVGSLVPRAEPARNGRGGGRRRGDARRLLRNQTVPCHILVDAHLQREGKRQLETVVWGAGEDLVARRRRETAHGTTESELWQSLRGSESGFKSGRDDVTALSIFDDEYQAGLLVGRASGDLRLLSLGCSNFGHTRTTFEPAPVDSGLKPAREIQSLDFSSDKRTLAAATKDRLSLYLLTSTPGSQAEAPEEKALSVPPLETVNLQSFGGSQPFTFVRCIKYTENGDLALGLASSTEPLRYLASTPTGLRMHTVSKMVPSQRAPESYALKDWANMTARGILPVNTQSLPGGRGSVVLSSYDDGTIRLQDLRTPSPIDSIYQDNFEIMTPVGPLLSYGTERFIAGNARSSTIKVFDYRWSKPYHYTAALPCSSTVPFPAPRSPTMAPRPTHARRGRCDNARGVECCWHALSRQHFYRPNYTVYLPLLTHASSPIYTLAKPSDLSPNLYAGLAGELVEVRLRDGVDDLENGAPDPADAPAAPYSYHRGRASILETGDGFALEDIFKSQRVPEMRSQFGERETGHIPDGLRKMHRLDERLQHGTDFSHLNYGVNSDHSSTDVQYSV